MLKKAGIVVAAAAAGLLAVSPLAFAGDKDDHHDRDHDGHKKVKVEDVNKVDDSNNGLINVSDNNVAIPVNVCDNNVPIALIQVPVQDSIASLTGALGLFGKAKAESENTISTECEANAEAGDKIKQSND